VPTVGEGHRDQGNERSNQRTCRSITAKWNQEKGSWEGTKSERASYCNHVGYANFCKILST